MGWFVWKTPLPRHAVLTTKCLYESRNDTSHVRKTRRNLSPSPRRSFKCLKPLGMSQSRPQRPLFILFLLHHQVLARPSCSYARANSYGLGASRLRLRATSPVPLCLSSLLLSQHSQFFRHLVQALVALIACDNPPPSAAATQEALSAIQENLRELDTLCGAASAPFVCAQSSEELEARRDSLAAQAASNNVRTYCVLWPNLLRNTLPGQTQGFDRFSAVDV